MTRAEVEELVNNVLVEEFEKSEDELKAEASLFDDLELDSLDGIDLIVALEKAVKAKTGKEYKEVINE
jgi:acyl carrier protein